MVLLKRISQLYGWNLEQSNFQLTFYKIIIMSSLLYSPLLIKALRLKINCYFAYVSILGCRWRNDWHLVHLGSRAAGGGVNNSRSY
jgi:hypothetical protein